jgi:tetratricopeptide (TPR) repeat protein/predicted aspartyl protease
MRFRHQAFGRFCRPFRRLAGGVVLWALALAGAPAWAKCELTSLADLPVTMQGLRALLPAKINGQDVRFVLDSGAFYSFITPANAQKFKLPQEPLPYGLRISGVTGVADAHIGTVNVLTLVNVPLRNMQFIVAGGEFGSGSVGLMGQNVLGLFDVDYDLANGTIHLLDAKGCSRQSDMVYWSDTAPESVVDLETDNGSYVGSTKAAVYVNGVRLIAQLDTGAPGSTMTRKAAARAGITPNDPDVVFAGYAGGIGKDVVRSWITTIKSFKIGQEELKNTKMRFGEIELGDADMLLGEDFFLSHRILVSNKVRKIYMTYNGGPVFDFSQTPTLITANAPGPATPGAAAAPLAPSIAAQADPTGATGFARRGAGFAARGQLAPAIADLSKAIQLAPTVADYPYQRGLIYLRTRQPRLAEADFDQTLKLQPAYVAALVARASVRVADHQTAQAVQDLEAADKASAKEDDIRLWMAALYDDAAAPTAAIDQYSLWIDAHAEDSRLPEALNGRCWQRALMGVDLDKALSDCNRAIRTAPKNAGMFDSRGLVHLRLGEFDKAIADYDAALAINPKLGWSLYCRGLAKQRKGLTAEGAADMAAATAIDPKLPDEVKRRGLTT